MEPDRSPAQLIAESEGLLLDFDGPVCDVYAGSNPAQISRDVAAMFDLDIETDDPLDLITHAIATGGPVDAIHQALTKTEIKAVRTAIETPGVRQLIQSYHGPIAIVSNNAAQAIDDWLTEAGLRSLVANITGRCARQMKPDPWPVIAAAKAIRRRTDQCVLVGDSLSDTEAASEAGSRGIALANKSHKREQFQSAGLDAIVDRLEDLL